MMTKNEFMIKLQEALENDLDASAVRDNVNYYSNYIDDEMFLMQLKMRIL